MTIKRRKILLERGARNLEREREKNHTKKLQSPLSISDPWLARGE